MENMFVLSLSVVAMVFVAAVATIVGVLLCSKIQLVKKFVTLDGYEVRFNENKTRFVSDPDRYHEKGWVVLPIRAKIKSEDLYHSVRGGLSADRYIEVKEEYSMVTSSVVAGAVVVGNDVKKAGFIKTFLSI